MMSTTSTIEHLDDVRKIRALMNVSDIRYLYEHFWRKGCPVNTIEIAGLSTLRKTKPTVSTTAPAPGRIRGDLFACSAGDPHRTSLPPASTACFPRSPASGESRNRVCGRAHGSPHRRSILARRGAGSARHRSRTASARPARDEPRNASCGCWAGMSGRPVDRFGPRPFPLHQEKRPTFVARQFCSLTLGGGFSTFLFAS